MAWLLVGILVQNGMIYAKPVGIYATMEQCFEVRQYVMDQAPQPKINYESVCINTDQLKQL